MKKVILIILSVSFVYSLMCSAVLTQERNIQEELGDILFNKDKVRR